MLALFFFIMVVSEPNSLPAIEVQAGKFNYALTYYDAEGDYPVKFELELRSQASCDLRVDCNEVSRIAVIAGDIAMGDHVLIIRATDSPPPGIATPRTSVYSLAVRAKERLNTAPVLAPVPAEVPAP